MAVIKAVSSKAGIGQALDYVTKEEKTEEKLVSGLHCEADTVKDEMQATKELWGKTGGRTYKHFVQSYHEDEHITPEQAHKNAIELAKNTEAWKGHEVLIATHIDRGHIHSHFIVNSVNYEDGHKLQWSNQDLKDLKERCNEQSREQGLHVPEKGKTFSGEEREETVAWNKDTYNILKQAEQGKVKSYVQDIALAVLDCKETATSRQDFIERMEQRGYKTDWQDNHKYITWTDLARENAGEKACKIRDNYIIWRCHSRENLHNQELRPLNNLRRNVEHYLRYAHLRNLIGNTILEFEQVGFFGNLRAALSATQLRLFPLIPKSDFSLLEF